MTTVHDFTMTSLDGAERSLATFRGKALLRGFRGAAPVSEAAYRVDRMLTQLHQAGILNRAKALVFGEMRGCQQDGGPSMDDVLVAVAREFSGPVLKGFPSGHTAGPTWTLPLGVRVHVRAASRPAVIVEESPVE